MGLFDGLFGKPKRAAAAGKPPPAPVNDGDGPQPAALLVVLGRPGSYTSASLQAALRTLDMSTRGATVEMLAGTAEQGTPSGRAAWRAHAVDCVGFDQPAPAATVERCVQSAYYAGAIKARVRAHRANAVLFYSGEATDPLEQYVALASMAAAFAPLGGTGVLNESAMMSLPVDVVHKLATAKPNFDVLRHMPLLTLFCGFVKYFQPDGGTAWMRTYNNPRFGLPDLAAKGPGNQAQATHDQFTALMAYLLESGRSFSPGHTAQFGDANLRFRAPRDDEPFPTHTDGQLLIVETVHG